MKKLRFFGIFSVTLFVFAVIFFIANIEATATDNEILVMFGQKETVFNVIESEEDAMTEEIQQQDFVAIDKNSVTTEKPYEDTTKTTMTATTVTIPDTTTTTNNATIDKVTTTTTQKPHTHTEKAVFIAPTCFEEGANKMVCSVCNEVLSIEKVAKLKHDWEEIWTIDANPESDGSILYRCNICYDRKDEFFPYDASKETSLYLPSIEYKIDVVFAECNQESTDRYDVSCDNDFIDELNPVLFGHNTRSLQYLYKVKVGDIVYFTYNGEIRKYKVTVSEEGMLINGGTDIEGVETGATLLTKFEKETLHFFTCHSMFNRKSRWIVFAERIE